LRSQEFEVKRNLGLFSVRPFAASARNLQQKFPQWLGSDSKTGGFPRLFPEPVVALPTVCRKICRCSRRALQQDQLQSW
jgi:hypothetical protein